MLFLGYHSLHQSEDLVLPEELALLNDLLNRIWVKLLALLLSVIPSKDSFTTLVSLNFVDFFGTTCNVREMVLSDPFNITIEFFLDGLLELVSDLFPKVGEILAEPLNCVILLRKLLAELMSDFLSHQLLHLVVMILESPQFTTGAVQLVDHLVTLGRHLRINDRVNIGQETLELLLVVESFHLTQVDQMVVLLLPDRLGLAPASQLGFAVLDELLAEDLEAVVEIFHLQGSCC